MAFAAAFGKAVLGDSSDRAGVTLREGRFECRTARKRPVLLATARRFALAGGALFGPILGSVLNLLGATIGATIAFVLARYVAGDWVARKGAGRLKQLITGVEAEGWRFVAFVRLVPLFPFNLTNYALGLTRIGLLPYVVTSLLCMAPGQEVIGRTEDAESLRI